MTTLRVLAALIAFASIAPPAHAADASQLLLVHGYGDSSEGKDCNGSTWRNALTYYASAGGRDRGSMTTIGYYEGDRQAEHGAAHGCDVVVGVGKATNERPIQDIARDFATYIDDAYTSHGKAVNIVAHSMGGLITRVALLGSGQGWDGFPSKLNVTNVVTLSTPHQGVANGFAHDDRQWNQMAKGSPFLTRLHEPGSGLDGDWADGTDWSLVGSDEDETVVFASGIDHGNHADQKYGYWDESSDSGEVTHSAVRTLYGENGYKLNYSRGGETHTTERGWSPLKTAFQAATQVGDGLPDG